MCVGWKGGERGEVEEGGRGWGEVEDRRYQEATCLLESHSQILLKNRVRSFAIEPPFLSHGVGSYCVKNGIL